MGKQGHSCIYVLLSLTSFPRTGFAPEIAGAAFFTPSLTTTTPDDGASGIVVAYTSCSGQVSVSQWAMSPPALQTRTLLCWDAEIPRRCHVRLTIRA